MSVDSSIIRQKFLEAMSDIFTPESPTLSGPEILQRAIATIKPLPDQLAYMQNNGANLMTFAKAEGKLISLGRKKGYRLPTPSEALAISAESVRPTATDEQEESESKADVARQWEGFLHFPATLVLSKKFKGVVVSLPKAQGEQAYYSNPDMVVVSDRYAHLEGDLDEHLEVIRQFGAEARYVLTSVELKYNIKNRKNFILAVAETTANSSWANASWLVFMQQPSVDRDIGDKFPDENSLEIARRSQIGVLEIIVAADGDYLDYIPHVYPTTRPALTIETSKIFDTKYLEIAKDALDIFKQSEKDTVRSPVQRVAALLKQATKNLEKQTGFRTTEAMETVIDSLRLANQADCDMIVKSLPDTLMDVAGALQLEGDAEVMATIEDALDKCRMGGSERRELRDKLRKIGFPLVEQKQPN